MIVRLFIAVIVTFFGIRRTRNIADQKRPAEFKIRKRQKTNPPTDGLVGVIVGAFGFEFDAAFMAETRAVADRDRVSRDHFVANQEAAAQHRAGVARRLNAVMAEARRRVGEAIDPGRVQSFLKLTDRA